MSTKFEVRDSANYAAQVVVVPKPFAIPNADRLVGVGITGYTVITSKGGIQEGDLAVFFPAEAQISEKLACSANLHRHADLNADQSVSGYLEDNRRVRAIRLRGTVSNGLLLPVSEVAGAFGKPVSDFTEGVIFDHIDGAEVSRKYRIKEPVPRDAREKAALKKAFKRVDEKLFPAHIETDQWFRNEQYVSDDAILIVTQKLHGTSWRGGRVPVRRKLNWIERTLRKLGVAIQESTMDAVFGSRQVIKDVNNPNQQHFYGTDLWTEFGKSVEAQIPENFIVYGELVGWTADGAEIQKGHTYGVPQGEARLYVYRVSIVTDGGDLYDLSWDQVRTFCGEHGFEHVPELWRGFKRDFDATLFEEKNFFEEEHSSVSREGDAYGEPTGWKWIDTPVPLSLNGTGKDEGVAIRTEFGGRVPRLFKIKNASHYEFETKQLDSGEVDMESSQS